MNGISANMYFDKFKKWGGTLVLGLALGAAWSASSEPAQAAPAGGGSGTASVRQSAASGKADAKLRIQTLCPKVERLRGLHFRQAVNCHFCTQDQVSEYMAKSNRENARPDISGRRDLFFRHLNLLGKAQTFQNYTDLLYTEQVRGLYDTVSKVLLVVTDIFEDMHVDKMLTKILDTFNIDLSDVLLVHELCHALQDQNFDLGGSLKKSEGSLDKELAVTAAAEGDATMLMFEYMADAIGISSDTVTGYIFSSPETIQKAVSQFPQLSSSPAIVRAVTLMPYMEGLKFLKTVQEQQGLRGRNIALQTVPLSTEQVMHPFKFVKGVDIPMIVDLSRLPKVFGDYVSLGDDTAGEFVIDTWAGTFLGDNSVPAISAGRGWAGDTWRVYAQNAADYGVKAPETVSLGDALLKGVKTGRKAEDGDASVNAGGASGNNADISAENGSAADGAGSEAEEKSSATDGKNAAPAAGSGSFVVWASVWDTPGDASEFAEALKKGLGGKVYVQSYDRSVTALIGVPADKLAQVKKAVAGPSVEIRAGHR